VATGTLAIGHRAIAEFVNMETMLAGLQAREFAHDLNAAIRLRERDLAFHPVISKPLHRSDRVSDFRWRVLGPGRSAAAGAPALPFLRLRDLELHDDRDNSDACDHGQPCTFAHRILLRLHCVMVDDF
jgi:hypothetical protein